jgi:DNA processing protein
MNWANSANPSFAKQQRLFLDLTDEEQRIYDALINCDNKHVNRLAVETGVPVSQLFFTLLEMEMKNIIKPLPGGTYRIV